MTFKNWFNRISLLVGLALFSASYNYAQDKSEAKENKKEAIQKLVESKRFTFIARSASPMGGRFIQLTSLYDLKLSADTVKSDLPYYGRAYVAPLNPTESALRFTSTDFNYDIRERKKGGWDITITPKDAKDVRQMQMTVSENGYASLQVTSINRQPISFSGIIDERNRS
jgi:hypothetical protein